MSWKEDVDDRRIVKVEDDERLIAQVIHIVLHRCGVPMDEATAKIVSDALMTVEGRRGAPCRDCDVKNQTIFELRRKMEGRRQRKKTHGGRVKFADIPGFDAAEPSGSRYGKAIRQAFQRGKAWRLTPDTYRRLSEQPCTYCGEPTGTGVGLDRVDNARGYEPGNVLPCCPKCNTTRGAHLSVEEMRLVMAERGTSGV